MTTPHADGPYRVGRSWDVTIIVDRYPDPAMETETGETGTLIATAQSKPWAEDIVSALNDQERSYRLTEWLARRGAPADTTEMIDWLDRLLVDLPTYRQDRQAAANAGTTIRHLLDVHLNTCCQECAAGARDVSTLGEPPHSHHLPGSTG